MSAALIAASVITVAGTAYAANQSSKASKKASAALGGMQAPDLEEIPAPQTVDWQNTLSDILSANKNNLPGIFDTANQVNRFNLGQAQRNYTGIQPYFKAIQEQLGRNALSYSKGQLPSDVVSSINRAAAQSGLANGIGGGARSGGAGTALGSLNARNLGLTSLELSKYGSELGMRANQSAASMSPGLFDVNNLMLSPGQALGVETGNAGIINNWNAQNTQIRNAEATGNAELANSVLQGQTEMEYQRRLANAQAVQSATNSVAGLAGSGAFGGTGGGMNSGGFFSTPQGAQSSIGGYGGAVTSSPYGYAVRPRTY